MNSDNARACREEAAALRREVDLFNQQLKAARTHDAVRAFTSMPQRPCTLEGCAMGSLDAQMMKLNMALGESALVEDAKTFCMAKNPQLRFHECVCDRRRCRIEIKKLRRYGFF